MATHTLPPSTRRSGGSKGLNYFGEIVALENVHSPGVNSPNLPALVKSQTVASNVSIGRKKFLILGYHDEQPRTIKTPNAREMRYKAKVNPVKTKNPIRLAWIRVISSEFSSRPRRSTMNQA